MGGLSARAVICGKRATKNLRKLIFSEVLFDLLRRTNRSFFVFSGVLLDLLRRSAPSNFDGNDAVSVADEPDLHMFEERMLIEELFEPVSVSIMNVIDSTLCLKPRIYVVNDAKWCAF